MSGEHIRRRPLPDVPKSPVKMGSPPKKPPETPRSPVYPIPKPSPPVYMDWHIRAEKPPERPRSPKKPVPEPPLPPPAYMDWHIRAKKPPKRRKEPEKPGPRRSHDDDVFEMYKDYDLYLAAVNGHLDDFKRIYAIRVSTAGSVDILSRFSPARNTFLHVAAKHGNKEILVFVATTNISLLSAKNLYGETALHLAAKRGDESMVKALVQIHRDWLLSQPLPPYPGDEDYVLMVENERGNTALHEALFSGKKSNSNSIAEYLIQQAPDLSYHANNKGQSALYVAAKTGVVGCVSLILQLCTDEERLNEIFKEKSPIKAAIKRKHRAVLEAIFKAKPKLIEMRDTEGRTPLHFAASFGHLEEARYLLSKCALNASRKDRHGALPIHLAAFEGHVDIISLLLQDSRDAGELLDTNGCTILHVAAKSGRYNVISFVLKNPRFNYLINMKDDSGNTPLHLASMQFHPKIVSTLTWDERVDVKAVNDCRMTALDVAEDKMSYIPKFSERLTWAALKGASIPRHCPYGKASHRKWSYSDMRSGASGEASDKNKYSNMGNHKERVNTLLVVATLVATVTFAAGFTMPGGYNSSESRADTGMATMLREKRFHVFLFCDTIAMYSSIIAATALIWAQLDDLTLAISALTLAVPLLGIALGMMSVAFTAGIIIVVTKLKWLSTATLAMGISFLAFLLLLLLPLCTSFTSTNPILRRLSYYPFLLLVLVTSNK